MRPKRGRATKRPGTFWHAPGTEENDAEADAGQERGCVGEGAVPRSVARAEDAARGGRNDAEREEVRHGGSVVVLPARLLPGVVRLVGGTLASQKM